MSIKHCINLFPKLNISSFKMIVPIRNNFSKSNGCRSIHTTCRKFDLMEFFEDPKNWSKEEIKVGRSWRVDELRLKSNEDLHKIWYVVLKEKNMLLTMEHYYKENYILFPNPERIDKVEESMKNIETVVRERNRAYFELETGETGERPGRVIVDPIGMKHWRNLTQHIVPKWASIKWKHENPEGCDVQEVEKFHQLFKEKNISEKRMLRREEKRYLRGLLRRFPNIDIEYLKELYPYFNFSKELDGCRTKGHFVQRTPVKS